MNDIYIDILGWIGAVLVLIPYFLISSGMITNKSYTYLTTNLIGACLMMCNSYYYGALPSVFSNVIWILIAVIGMRSILKERITNA